MAQEGIQADIHNPKKPSIAPIARKVAMPEMMNDIMPDKRKPNRNGANRGCIGEALLQRWVIPDLPALAPIFQALSTRIIG